MFTIVASSTTISWARPTTARISQRRGSGASPAVAEGGRPFAFGILISDIALSYLEDLSPVRHRELTMNRRRCLRLR